MSHKVNLIRHLTAATGNSTPITLGAAYSQLFMTMAEAGAIDGRTYSYLIVDGNNWELGRGAYTASGTTLARTTIIASRISGTLGTSRISLSGTAQVRVVDAAEDMDGVRGTRAVTGTSDTLNNSDMGYVVTYSNAAAVAVSLAQASVSNLFLDGWAVWTQNLGAGAVTVTPATSTINSAATLVLPQNMGAFIWSDGTNYHAYFVPVTKPALGATTVSGAGLATGGGDLSANRTITVTAAVQSDQETGTSNTVAVTPGTQKHHPSAAKAWINFNGTGTIATRASHNVSSVTDNSSGNWTVNYTTAFSSASYAYVFGYDMYTGTDLVFLGTRPTSLPTAGGITVQTLNPGLSANPDISSICVTCFGDQ